MNTMTNTTADLFDEMRAEGDTWSYAEQAEHYAYTLPENALTFDNIADMRRQIVSSGSHYFDRDAIRFFLGRTDRQLYGRRFWVESRQFEDSDGTRAPREYMVAWVSRYDNGSLSVEKRGSFSTLETARGWAKRLAQSVADKD